MTRYRFTFTAIFFAVLLLCTGQGVAQSATFARTTYPLLGNTHKAADLNLDGKLDLAGSGLPAASVMLNNGVGGFGPRVDHPVAGYTQDVAAGDFNSDGRPDLVMTVNTAEISLSLLTGNGNGTFNAPINFANTSGADSPSVAATDLNNDGRLDVVITHSIACFKAPCVAATTISVMLGNGDGTFQPTRELPGGELMHTMTVGDFNGDNIKDLAIGGENTELFIQLGLGDGTFNRLPAMFLIPGGDAFSACNDVDVADFNRDGIQDLVVPLGNGRGNVVLLGNGDGTFRQSARITENALNAPYNLAVADYNGDGFEDIARAMGLGDQGLMEIANGNGDGTFRPVIRYLVPPPMSSRGAIFISANDLNGDGRPDIVLDVGGASASTEVLLNTTGTPPPSPIPTPTPTPAPIAVASLTLNPSLVTGGGASTGTVTLSARPQMSTVVNLSSSSSSATVPVSVTVAAGALSANFPVTTTQVIQRTTATITARLNSTSRSATLTIDPPGVDSVSITRAEYEVQNRRLRVEATSNRSNATLQALVTASNQFIGTLTNRGGGRYEGQFNLASNPQNITVRSNFGGQASRTVTLK